MIPIKCSSCKEPCGKIAYSSPTGMICEDCQVQRITEAEKEAKKSVDKSVAKKKLKK